MNDYRVCAYSCICEEDRGWIPMYLEEAERLALPFVMHFDRCSDAVKHRIINHPLCVASSSRDQPTVEFDETHKQAPFDLVKAQGFTWAMAWDVDESYEREARVKIDEICAMDVDYVDIIWHNLWETPEFIRVDGPFESGHRVKFYNLKRRLWKFTHKITNGAKIVDKDGKPIPDIRNPQRERAHRHNLVCLHWGMMTRQMREMHKERWDRIYTTAVGGNPYGFWDYALNEKDYPATVRRHNFLPEGYVF